MKNRKFSSYILYFLYKNFITGSSLTDKIMIPYNKTNYKSFFMMMRVIMSLCFNVK